MPKDKKPLPFEVKVDCSRGAPMGRYGGLDVLTKERLHLRRVPFQDGDYDPGGAYWGGGQPLWCAWVGDGSDPEHVAYVRAGEARDSAKQHFPNATFYK